MPPKGRPGRPPGSKTSIAPTYQCTGCPKEIKTSYEAHFHPLIGCLICRKCYTGYGTGDFSVDLEDGVDEFGDDNYCRWCCDGGELFGCTRELGNGDRCHYAFCKDCISKNVPHDDILRLEELPEEERSNMRWMCYYCDDTKIQKLKVAAQAAMKDLVEREQKRQNRNNSISQTKKRKAAEEKAAKEKAAQEKAVQEKAAKEKATQEKAAKEKAAQEKATQEKAAREKAAREKEALEKEERAARKKAAREKEAKEKEAKERRAKEKEAKEREAREREAREAARGKPEMFKPNKPLSERSVQPKPVSENGHLHRLSTENSPQVRSVPLPPTPLKTIPDRPPQVKTVSLTGTPPRSASDRSIQDRSIRPSPPKRLKRSEIEPRLRVFKSTMECCVEEIKSNFSTVVEMLTSSDTTTSNERKKLEVNIQIDTLRKPISDFENMLEEMKRLNSAL